MVEKIMVTETTGDVSTFVTIATAMGTFAEIKVPTTKHYILFDGAKLRLWLYNAAAHLANNAEIVVYVAPPEKNELKEIDRFQYAPFRNATSQYDKDFEQHISLEKDIDLPELYWIILKCSDATATVSASVFFQLEVKKY